MYVGHTGTGFNEGELARVMTRLKRIETTKCPFQPQPKTNERPHWVKPSLVAQIKFTEWTADGKLRHPVYLGLRDDKKPEDVRREPQTRLHQTSNRVAASDPPPRAKTRKASVEIGDGRRRSCAPSRTRAKTACSSSRAGGD